MLGNCSALRVDAKGYLWGSDVKTPYASPARAIANLERFALVGVTDHYDEFMIGLAHTMGWPLAAVTYKRLKVVLNRPSVGSHHRSVLRLISHHFRDDIACKGKRD